MAAEIRLNADNAQLTLNELADFTKQAKKFGIPGSQPIGVQVVEGVAVFSVPVTLVHRSLTNGKQRRS